MEGMAGAALSALLEAVVEKLASSLLEEYGLVRGVQEKMENLGSMLSTIEAVLADAEERQIKDEAVRNWLGKLRVAAYDADNILDEFTTEALRRKVEVQGRFKNKVRDFFSRSNPLMFRSNMGRKIKEITVRLDAIAGERLKFHLNPREGERVREPTDSFVIEPDVVGRKEDKEKVIQLLIDAGDEEEEISDRIDGGDEEKEISVIPVVGMGGVGKTTLAQLVFNDKSVEKHFYPRMWVCASDDFSMQRLTEAIFKFATAGQEHVPQDMDSLQRSLREKLSGRKFLLVLDDVWDENRENWERLKQYLRGGMRGSKILVTTRSQEVASTMGTLPAYNLERLSDDDCWSLFRQRAFPQGRQEEPNLVRLGKEIVKKCGGLPLAGKALGSMMMFKTEEREWSFVMENEIWNYSEENDGILPALWLSYYHLPSHLKQCFAYCSVFPKYYRMEKRQLILLWMAEGFIRSGRGSKEMEDIGEEYFNNLVSRSFFQNVEKYDDGKRVWCKMHDLMHDLACSVAGRSPACSVSGVECRHLSIECNSGRLESTNAQALKNLRTLLLLTTQTTRLPPNVSFNFKYLRVLDLSSVHITAELLSSIGELKHLRYLDLSCTKIQTLPESISTLYNLQTLRLSGCRDLKNLPKDMMKMTSLRHLEIDGVPLTRMPAKIGELSSLQTLPFFIVGEESGCSIRELKGLNLHGSLSIEKLENVKGLSDAREAKLNEKPNLDELTFCWGTDIDYQLGESVEKTLESLEPHPNLQRLSVEEYGGIRFPNWLSSLSLRNLLEISLMNCRRCEQLPSFGRLPFLKVLRICGMHAVKCIDRDFYGDNVTVGFPLLEELTFRDMPNFEEGLVPLEGKEAFPCLKKLTVDGCSKLMTLPCLQSLENLELANSNEELLSSLANLTSIATLDIKGFEEVESLPDGLFHNHSRLRELEIINCRRLKSLSSELGNLSSLCRLCIENCTGLTSLMLQGCSSLRSVSVKNCQNLVCLQGDMQNLTALEELTFDKCPELTVLPEGMQHLTSLRHLSIWNCDKLTCLPEGLQHVATLEYLRIWSLDSLTALPEWIGNLSSLQNLSIDYCNKLTCLPKGLQHVATLEYLSISNCNSLTALPEWTGNLFSLRNLSISYCDKLTCLPEGLQHVATLEDLRIWGLDSLTALPEWIGNLSSLRNLSIGYCDKLTCLPEGRQHLATLEYLSISGFNSLTALPEWIGNLSSLRYLSIGYCDKLTCLPEGLQHVTTLEHLDICSLDSLTALPEWIRNLSSLRNLSICLCDKLTCLPEGLQHVATLEDLDISGCNSLTALPEWIGNLSSLRYLSIWRCNNLTSLPCGLRRLTNLQRLSIAHNPQLAKRCKKETGKDWDKIAHIPDIDIRFGYENDDEDKMEMRCGQVCKRVLEVKTWCMNALRPAD